MAGEISRNITARPKTSFTNREQLYQQWVQIMEK